MIQVVYVPIDRSAICVVYRDGEFDSMSITSRDSVHGEYNDIESFNRADVELQKIRGTEEEKEASVLLLTTSKKAISSFLTHPEKSVRLLSEARIKQEIYLND